MVYTEIQQDLFKYLLNNKDNTAVAHCISRDLVMGAGIAKRFTLYGVKDILMSEKDKHKDFDSMRSIWVVGNRYSTPIYKTIVFNLITKERYYEKPTYETMNEALISLRKSIDAMNEYYEVYDKSSVIKRLALPKIGCGLDRLSWENVSKMIQQQFKDSNIEIVVCYL